MNGGSDELLAEILHAEECGCQDFEVDGVDPFYLDMAKNLIELAEDRGLELKVQELL